MDEEGFIDGSFNTHFLKLSASDKEKNLALAKAIPYAKPNEDLVNFRLGNTFRKPGGIGHLLEALRECELKNDALLYSLYEYIGERYEADHTYAIYVFFGTYDVPRKGADKENQWESEEVYQFLIVSICPIVGDYEVGAPEAGFLYPAFSNHSMDFDGINVYGADGTADKLAKIVLD